MSSGLQNKMYNFEVAPPAGTWEKIAAELDESELSGKFPARLHNMAVAPPAWLWQHIAKSLDESELVNDYSSRLYDTEVAPPATAWNKIKTSLVTEDEAAVSEQRKFSPLLKYAAAAAIMGLMAWGGIQFLGNKQGNTAVAKEEISSTKEGMVIPPTNPIVTNPDESIVPSNGTALADEARNDAALEASKKTFAKLDMAATRSKIKNAANFYFAAESFAGENARVTGTSTPGETAPTDIASRYILLMTPDGNIIRMSKKLSDMVCCVSGAEQDENCKDQMKKWQEKIACSPIAHAPGNFMDILSLANSLQDKNE